jgi:hypothetical protein
MANETSNNFFIILDLNPDVPWDQEQFERRLREKQNQWSRESTGFTKKAQIAKKRLDMFSDIKRVMNDKAQRDAQARAARDELSSDRRAREEEFTRRLHLAERKGFLEQSEVDGLIAEFQDVLEEKESRARITVEIRVPVTDQNDNLQLLEPVVLADINEKLMLVEKKDLYQLLDMPATTSYEELYRAADQLYNEMIHCQPKTAGVTAQTVLAGHARTLFKTEEMRRRYDASVRYQILNALLKEFDATLKYATEKRVYAAQIETFVESASQVGWPPEVALQQLSQHALQQGWQLQMHTGVEIKQKLRCGFCGKLSEQERTFCRHCNNALYLTCPNCGQNVASEEKGCGSCGFSTGNCYVVENLLNLVQIQLLQGNIAEAQKQLTAAEQAWQPSAVAEEGWVPSHPDERVRRIRAYKAELQLHIQKKQQVVERMRQLVTNRLFYSAQNYLTTIQDTDLRSYQSAIDREIAQAREVLRQASVPSVSDEGKIRFCQQALHLCADFQEARDLLSTLPLPPPRDLQATVATNVVHLSWNSSPLSEIQYVVVRKSHSQPTSYKDGLMLGSTVALTYEDTLLEVGIPLYYAVFSECAGVVSPQGALLQQPVSRLQDIRNEKIIVDNQLVTLSWEIPANVHTVHAIRKENAAPLTKADGQSVPVNNLTGIVDRVVRNNQPYFYGIYCNFQLPDGHLVTSGGKIIKAIPVAPPAVINELRFEQTPTAQGFEICVYWQPPIQGEKVVILKSRETPASKVGESILAAELSQHGQVLEGDSNSVLDVWAEPDIAFYTPVILLRERAYMGVTQRCICMHEVRNLRFQNTNSGLRLSWLWPPDCNKARLFYSTEHWPQPDKTNGQAITVTRAEYEALGHYLLHGTTQQNYYVLVSLLVCHQGLQFLTSGVRLYIPLANKMDITYEIKNPRFGYKQRTLHIYTQTPGILPTLLLITRQGSLPLGKAEGTLLHRELGPFNLQHEHIIQLPDTPFPSQTFGKLFLENDDLYAVVVIHHPHERKLRLS